MESDFRYFTRRAAEERRLARFSITPAAQERHSELADMFASKAAHRVREDAARARQEVPLQVPLRLGAE